MYSQWWRETYLLKRNINWLTTQCSMQHFVPPKWESWLQIEYKRTIAQQVVIKIDLENHIVLFKSPLEPHFRCWGHNVPTYCLQVWGVNRSQLHWGITHVSSCRINKVQIKGILFCLILNLFMHFLFCFSFIFSKFIMLSLIVAPLSERLVTIYAAGGTKTHNLGQVQRYPEAYNHFCVSVNFVSFSSKCWTFPNVDITWYFPCHHTDHFL